jgi:uncharacterized protein (TIGR02246 family)
MRRRFTVGLVSMVLALAFAWSSDGADHGAALVDAGWVKGMKANDVEAVLKCYASDAVLWLPGAPTARGDKEIRAAYEGFLGANTVKDAVLSDVAYRSTKTTSTAWGRFSLTIAPKAGGDAVTMTGRFTEVAERRNGRWVYVVDHASADPPKP